MVPPTTKLETSNGIPLYRQIKEILQRELNDGTFSPDTAITEAQLLRRFGVSRAPIRQALGELADEGLIYRKRGRGTFPIPTPKITRPSSLRSGALMNFLNEEGLHPSTTVTSPVDVPSPAFLHEIMDVDDTTYLTYFCRTISSDSTPVAFSENYLNLPAGIELGYEYAASARSTFDMLTDLLGPRLSAEHEAWASAATTRISHQLKVALDSPVLIIETHFFLENKNDAAPVAWRRSYHPADSFHYRFVDDHED